MLVVPAIYLAVLAVCSPEVLAWGAPAIYLCHGKCVKSEQQGSVIAVRWWVPKARIERSLSLW